MDEAKQKTQTFRRIFFACFHFFLSHWLRQKFRLRWYFTIFFFLSLLVSCRCNVEALASATRAILLVEINSLIKYYFTLSLLHIINIRFSASEIAFAHNVRRRRRSISFCCTLLCWGCHWSMFAHVACRSHSVSAGVLCEGVSLPVGVCVADLRKWLFRTVWQLLHFAARIASDPLSFHPMLDFSLSMAFVYFWKQTFEQYQHACGNQ